MTKKDYKLFAKRISKIENKIERSKTAEVCASVFKKDNKRFKANLFFSACYEA